MNRNLRFATACVAVLLTGVLTAIPAVAQQWPTKPIKILVPWAPGGVADVITRIITQPLSDALAVPVIVENRPGGSGILGTEIAARAAPDGYTLISFVDTNTILPSTVKQLAHDPDRSFAPITLIARGAPLIVVHPSLPVSNFQEFIRYAKAHPGELSYATPGTGSPHHLAAETIKREAGIEMTHIPYKGGGPAVIDLLGGQVKVGVLGLAPVLPHIRAGKLKAIAVTGANRAPLLPGVASVAESGLPGFATSQWVGVSAPAGTPPEIVIRIHAALVQVMRQPAVIEKVSAQGMEALTSASPADFQKMIHAELQRWPAMVKAAGIQPE